MSSRDRVRSRVESRWSRASNGRDRGARRGVLLLVVLSLLVLFMLIGTAFLMSSNQYRESAKDSAKNGRLGSFPTPKLDEAMKKLLRDTNNPNSAIRYHSLLRDLYGTDGFEAQIYQFHTGETVDLLATGQTTRFASAIAGQPLGPTQGQLIDIYVKSLTFGQDDPTTPLVNTVPESNESKIIVPDTRHAIKLERDVNGQPQPYVLARTKGYYNGCLLTIASGSAAGQSARIVDFDYISPVPAATATSPAQLFRFRVIAFPRADGLPLQINPSRKPEIGDLAGATLVVNGRPFNGTGAGLNPMAGEIVDSDATSISTAVGPKLDAVEAIAVDASNPIYPEVALCPNSTYFIASDPTTSGADQLGVRYKVEKRRKSDNGLISTTYPALNPKSVAANARATLWKYPTFVGAGDSDESYDAADFQNMYLALQTVTPRPRGRVVLPDDTKSPADSDTQPDLVEVDDPLIKDPSNGQYAAASVQKFLRLDLEDLPLPSFHRPELFNYWYHRLMSDPWLSTAIPDADERAKAILQPYSDLAANPPTLRTGLSAQQAGQIVALKRKISMRPLSEDHPHFTGSNTQAKTDVSKTTGAITRSGQIAIPFWEAVGPWDVDNDNDGVPDSVWVDLGDPVTQAEDGTLYKPLYAFLVLDMDSRLNVNAHGTEADLARDAAVSTMPPNLDPTLNRGLIGNLAHDLTVGGLYSSNLLPHGLGYGTPEISLRPILSPLLPGSALAANVGNPGFNGIVNADDYARLLVGRPQNTTVSATATANNSIWGRQGSVDIRGGVIRSVQPGMPYDPTFAAPNPSVEKLTVFQFFGYPRLLSDYYAVLPTPTVPSAFSSPPDLMGRYAVGVDYAGQPVYEAKGDFTNIGNGALLYDSPYELNLSDSTRKEQPDASVAATITDSTVAAAVKATINDDAPFATADLERILRSYDPDSGILPDRLWSCVDAFDPLKMVQNQPAAVEFRANDLFDPINRSLSISDASAAPQMLAAAQQMASIARRLVTTDSYDLPVPPRAMPSYVSALGPDGVPGLAGRDDVSGPDVTKLGSAGSDDFEAVTGHQVGQATILDLLHYRVFLDLRMRYIEAFAVKDIKTKSWSVPLTTGPTGQEATLSNDLKTALITQTATLKASADVIFNGESFTDANNNGVCDVGEWTAATDDKNGNGVYDPPLAQILLAPEVIAGHKMDLNRPFGDGIDNNGNGVVDEPEEAGEPFVDANHNDRFDSGETYYDIDGNGSYTPPADQLWDGLVNESATVKHAEFNYNNGVSPYDGRAIYNNSGVYQGRLRDNGLLQRQVFARHLYCLMMLLVDDEYLASQNVSGSADSNINLSFMVDDLATQAARQKLKDDGNPNPTAAQVDAAKKQVQRAPNLWAFHKQTARKIAQWAVNCVDYRDADAIMTGFEYDEDPFDGWNCVEYDTVTPGKATRQSPLDSDIATNENWGNEVPLPLNDAIPTSAIPYILDFSGGIQVPVQVRKITTTSNDDYSPLRVNGLSTVAGSDGAATVTIGNEKEYIVGLASGATRAVVWGVERPELLITETLAFHDRRCTDEEDLTSSPPNHKIENPPSNPTPFDPPDFDLDQRLKPRGSLFVELYNPWSPDGAKPAELYSEVIPPPPPPPPALPPRFVAPVSRAGVMLNRLSEVGVNPRAETNMRRTPVWRVAVVREPFNGRLSNRVINISKPKAADFEAYVAQVSSLDADGYPVDSDQHSERFVYFTSGGDTNRSDDDNIENNASQLGEYNFLPLAAAPPGPATPMTRQLKVWVPPLPWREDTVSGAPAVLHTPSAKRYFIARKEIAPTIAPGGNDADMPISPILPGRYAVVGSSGLQLVNSGGIGPPVSTPDGQTTQRFVTPTSRIVATGGDPTDANGVQDLKKTRRIELWPSANANIQQLLVADNGGPEFVRMSGAPINVTDPDLDGNPTNTPPADIDPCVAIPVEEMNVSEPVEGYPSHQYQDSYYNNLNNPVHISNVKLNPEGELAFELPWYDHPLDLEFELVRNGTTQNYRSIHLQRLANPMLPWNPTPYDDYGKPNQLYQADLPVNPYRTIDSQSVDLTAYNGASDAENRLPATMAKTPPMAVTDRDVTQSDYFAPLSASDYRFAPDHVVWGLIQVLAEVGIPPTTVAEFRAKMSNPASAAEVDSYFRQLETNRNPNGTQDMQDRDFMVTGFPAPDPYNRKWAGQWSWSMFKRVLPDKQGPSTGPELAFKQQLSMRSLKRRAHDSLYLKYGNPMAPEGWWYDPAWVPRLLWKQEKPNVLLFLTAGAGAPLRVSDLITVYSQRQFLGGFQSGEIKPPVDELDRNRLISTKPTFHNENQIFNYVLDQTLGFANQSYAPELDRADGSDRNALLAAQKLGAPEVAVAGSTRAPVGIVPGLPDTTEINATPRNPSLLASPKLTGSIGAVGTDKDQLNKQLYEHRDRILKSTYPWLAWNDRPFVSENEIMQVPADSSSLMLKSYSVLGRSTPNPYDGDGIENPLIDPNKPETIFDRVARQQGIFGHLFNFFLAKDTPATNILYDIDNDGVKDTVPIGAPNYYRILDFVEVPSRFVGTETLLSPEIFNDVPTYLAPTEPTGTDIPNPADPRFSLQPPFNKVSRERDPGRVNLNTVMGRRERDGNNPAHIWSDVYDGIMHRYGDDDLRDTNGNVLQLGHLGPAWRDVAISRRGYVQVDSTGATVDVPGNIPDTLTFGLNNKFPTFFANPFRSGDAGDLVPLAAMKLDGVQATLLRSHPYRFIDPTVPFASVDWSNPPGWGRDNFDDNNDGIIDDARESGFGNDQLRFNAAGAIPGAESSLPLFSEMTTNPALDPQRNSYMMYQPMTRLGNLVTDHSNVFAVWVTVGYFEVEKAPDWNDSNATTKQAVRAKFGATNNDGDAQTIAGRALYDRVYPEGYMLGKEVGSDIGNTKRQRAFYIIDRTEPVGFKPGEDLNDDRAIRVRRRIE